ncbi:MAG: ATP-binding protein, partial [Deltaproteobacteria bacterium]|nr:ATP-binding protein [Deltaproteobacteria bacterium]
MGAIRILTEKVAAQIAAGEVIERPASVVRELVDNSIDAGAEKITARIKAGGRSLIRVADNGTGMDRDDLLLCLERHSTSKIKTVADLFSIKTLGFRGEALPSIASVSRMEIVSRAADQLDQLIGHKLKVAGGALKSIEETGAPAGTSVEVRDLFYNTPARRKFLRAINTETAHIIDTVLRVALPYTDIYFRLEEGERILLNLPPSKNLSNRLVTVFGRNVAGALIEGARDFEGFQ